MTSILLYGRAHYCNSTKAAVSLAEKTHSADDIIFARKILSVKMSYDNPDLSEITKYRGKKMTKLNKYADLLERLGQVEFPQVQTLHHRNSPRIRIAQDGA